MMKITFGSMLVVGLLACGVAGDEGEESQAQLGGADAPLTFAPTDDTFVNASSPSSVYGSSADIWCDSSPNRMALLKFKVAGVSGNAVKRARLSLRVTGGTDKGPRVYSTDTNWSESTVNYESRPRPTGAPIGAFRGLAEGTTVTLDVTSVIKGDGTYSFGLLAQSADAVVFGSKERPGASPKLELTLGPTTDAPPDAGPKPDAPPDAGPNPDAGASPPPDAGKVVQLGPSATAAQLLASIANNSIDVIELAAGTYSPGLLKVDVNRSRPVVVRPAAGAKVIWTSPSAGPGAFWFGSNGTAGNITLDGLIFDGFQLGDTGVIWVGNAHDITLTNITVRNSTGRAAYSWALYVSTDGTHRPSRIVANDWVVEGGGNRSLSAMTSYHAPNAQGLTLHRWKVKNVAYAIYAASDATGLDVADWTIENAGYTTYANIAVYFQQVKGRFKNIRLTSSGQLTNVGGTMTDGGGSSY